MSCSYYIGNGQWVDESQFKAILKNGLLDKLINDGKVSIDGYTPGKSKTKKTGEVLSTSSIPAVKLRSILIDEIKSRSGYPINMIEALELNAEGTDFKIPLWTSTFADKFESLLTSVVTKKVVKHKFSGRSYVLGSEEGFKLRQGEDALKELADSRIVFTDKFDPEKGLLPYGLRADGTIQPAQIMLPFHFQIPGKNGKRLKLSEFTTVGEDGRTMLDMTKIPEKMLNLFGFRIPTQGHNSMASCEIVGFLPEAMGDLVLAPQDFTVQMGSDFDVDKLYTYMYHIKQNEDGSLTTEFDPETEVEEYNQNVIMDIHHTVLQSTDPSIIRSVMSPDSFGKFDEYAKLVYEARQRANLIPRMTSVLSDIYHRTKYINATMGKSGVGTFSLDSTFNALIQGKKVKYQVVIDNQNVFSIRIGSLYTEGDLSNPYTLESQRVIREHGGLDKMSDEQIKNLRFKSDIIKGLQSSAVDNEKEQILDKVNINDFTFDTIRGMAQLGFEEKEIAALLSQEIIWKYVDFAKRKQSSTKLKFEPGSTEDLFKQSITDKYLVKDEDVEETQIDDVDKLSGDDLLKLLNSAQLVEGSKTSSNVQQLILLNKFLQFAEVGKEIKRAQSAINTESSGLPKDLLALSDKVRQINELPDLKLTNIGSLLGTYEQGQLKSPSTVNGFAAYYGTLMANDMYEKFFPYNKPGFQTQYNELLVHLGKENASASEQTELKKHIFGEIRSFLLTKRANGIVEGGIRTAQLRLFVNRNGNKSLASILRDLKKTKPKFMKNNNFLKLLTMKAGMTNQIDRVEYNAAASVNLDERHIYTDFIRLFTENVDLGIVNGKPYTSIDLGQDLVAYSYLQGGLQQAKQFMRYVPMEYVKGLPLANYMKALNFEYDSTFDGVLNDKGEADYNNPSRFVTQYFQNNPKEATFVKSSDLQPVTNGVNGIKVIRDKVKDTYVKQIIVPQGIISVPIMFIRDEKDNLYKYSPERKQYEKIPIVSDKYGFKQYDADIKADVVFSVLDSKNKDVPVETFIHNAPKPATETVDIKKVEPTEKFTAQVVNNPVAVEKTMNPHKYVDDMLSEIISLKTTSPYTKQLATILKALSLPDNFKIVFDKKAETKGSYDSANNILTINDSYEEHEIKEILLHELTHAHTSKLIKLWNRPDKRSQLTNEQKQIIAKLEGLRKTVFEHFKKTDAQGLKSFILSWKDRKKGTADELRADDLLKELDDILAEGNGLNQDVISKFYGAVKLEEFVAMSMTDKTFQRILNDIPKGDKSVMRQIIKMLADLISTLGKSLGIDIKDDSVLYNAVEENLRLMNVIKPDVITTSEAENEVFTKYELFPGIYANKGQTEALDKLYEFLDSDEQFFLLQGKGGTGKTTIIKQLVSKLEKKGRVLAITPTHKAKKVLKKSLESRIDITQEIEPITLESALAIKLDETTGKFEPDDYLRENDKVPIAFAKYIIIDEVSMISDKLFEEIKEFANPNAKIILMGDRAQLPPVGQVTDSSVFGIKIGYELTQKMRQAATSPIINIGTLVANNVENENNRVVNPITESQRVNKYDEESNSSVIWESDENKALNDFVKDFKENPTDVNNVKVITFNNQNHNSPQSVKNLNDKIRLKLYGKNANKQFVEGEILTAYDTYLMDTGQYTDETLFHNSDDLIVKNTSVPKNYSLTISVKSAAKGVRTKTFEFKTVWLELINDDGYVIPQLIPVIAKEDRQKFENTLSQLFKIDRQMAFALSKKFANLQYGYAITSHKAQGSTYKNVYVMEDNIMGPSNGGSVKSKNQSLYVAVSRPTTKLVMVSRKNDKTVDESIVKTKPKSAPTFNDLGLTQADLFSAKDLQDFGNFSSKDFDGPSLDDMSLYNNLPDFMIPSDEEIEDFKNFCK